MSDRITEVMASIEAELRSAIQRFAPFNSTHEGWAVLREEVDEMWDEVKANQTDKALAEAVQAGAMAARFILDCTPVPAKRLAATWTAPEAWR